MIRVLKYSKMLCALITAGSLIGCEDLRGIFINNQGVKKLVQGEFVPSEQKFMQSMARNPNDPIAHLNLGVTFDAQKKFDKSKKEYESTLHYPNLPADLTYIGHFNAGNSLAAINGSNKKNSQSVTSVLSPINQALKHYQTALDVAIAEKLEPSLIQEVKTNIELLIQQAQGQGKGQGGEGQNKEESQDQSGGQPQQNPNQNGEKEKPQKKKFQSENLTQEDVRKILEELKSQEKKIRALEYGGKSKEANPGKDW